MTREEELDWLYRLRSEIYVYMPKEWIIPMNNALDMAIKALEYDDAKYHAEHGEVIVDKAVWEDAERALSGDYAVGVDSTGRFVKASEAFCDRNICLRNEYNGIGCDECEVTKSQEPSGDLISRQDAIKAIDEKAKRIKNEDTLNGLAGAVGILFDLPSVKQEPKTGHREYNDIYDHYLCENCKTIVMDYDNFCPNCGVKMVEEQESEEV